MNGTALGWSCAAGAAVMHLTAEKVSQSVVAVHYVQGSMVARSVAIIGHNEIRLMTEQHD